MYVIQIHLLIFAPSYLVYRFDPVLSHFLAFDISKNFMTVMGIGIGNSGIEKKWEWE